MKISYKNFPNYFLIAILILSFSSFFAVAQTSEVQSPSGEPGMQGPPPPGHRHCPMFMKQKKEELIKELGITPDQQKRIEAIKQESDAQMVAQMKCLFEKRKALMDYMLSPQATREQALAQQREISQLQSQIDENRINTMFKMKCVLTPAQQQKLIELYQKKMKDSEQKHRDFQRPEGMTPPPPPQAMLPPDNNF